MTCRTIGQDWSMDHRDGSLGADQDRKREREIKTSREKEAVECGTDTLQKIELPKLKSNKQRRDDEDQSRGPKYSLPSAMNPVARLSTTTKTQKHPWMIEVQQLRSPAICTESSGGP